MSSGVFNDLITGMNSGIQNGDLDLGKLMGTVQTMCSSLSSDINGANTSADGGSTENPMNMLNSLMSNMNTSGGEGGIPDLSNLTSILGPMLTSLNNNSAPVRNENNNKKIKDSKNLPSITEVEKLD